MWLLTRDPLSAPPGALVSLRRISPIHYYGTTKNVDARGACDLGSLNTALAVRPQGRQHTPCRKVRAGLVTLNWTQRISKPGTVQPHNPVRGNSR